MATSNPPSLLHRGGLPSNAELHPFFSKRITDPPPTFMLDMILYPIIKDCCRQLGIEFGRLTHKQMSSLMMDYLESMYQSDHEQFSGGSLALILAMEAHRGSPTSWRPFFFGGLWKIECKNQYENAIFALLRAKELRSPMDELEDGKVSFLLADAYGHRNLPSQSAKILAELALRQGENGRLSQMSTTLIRGLDIAGATLICRFPEIYPFLFQIESAEWVERLKDTMSQTWKKHFCSLCHQFERRHLQRCSRCKLTRYCSRECQRGHWRTHRLSCATRLK